MRFQTLSDPNQPESTVISTRSPAACAGMRIEPSVFASTTHVFAIFQQHWVFKHLADNKNEMSSTLLTKHEISLNCYLTMSICHDFKVGWHIGPKKLNCTYNVAEKWSVVTAVLKRESHLKEETIF